MADTLVSILDAINSRLDAKTATGESLASIANYYVKHVDTNTVDDYAVNTPVLFVEPLIVTITPISIPPCMYEKIYPVRFTIYTEERGDSTRNNAASLIDTIEDEFYLQDFSLCEWVDVVAKEYTAPSIAPYDFPTFNGASITFQYTHTDSRALPS